MQATTHSSPCSRPTSGCAWPERTRQTAPGPPSRAVDADHARLASTARLRASASGLVKSGEQQSIGIAKPAARIASPTRSR